MDTRESAILTGLMIFGSLTPTASTVDWTSLSVPVQTPNFEQTGSYEAVRSQNEAGSGQTVYNDAHDEVLRDYKNVEVILSFAHRLVAGMTDQPTSVQQRVFDNIWEMML